MATLTIRFPYRVALGFEGGSAYSTTVAALPSGREKRNANRINSMGRWVATHMHKLEADTQALISFYHAAGGRINVFPFRDWSDYKVPAGAGNVVLVTGSTYQLRKAYTSGGVTRYRNITRPLNQVVSGGGTYSVDPDTGLLTLIAGSPPTGWTGEFDCLCRFEADNVLQQITIANRQGGGGSHIYTWGDIAIVEVPV
jgi:uncharacterized protein (TIGR02217 family)